MNKIFRIALPIILILTVLFRWHQFDPPEIAISGIADERVAYPAELIDQAKAEGAILSKYFGDMKIRTAFYGKKAMLAYYSNVFCAHEAAASLTDVDMAHLPIQKRGRPGHEKRMPYPYLVQKEINFVLGGTFRSEENPDLPNVIIFEDVVAHIVVYKNEIMDELKKHPGVRFLDFPDYLDSYLEQADSYPKHKVTSDLHFFRQYYFEHNNDFERYQAIQKLQ